MAKATVSPTWNLDDIAAASLAPPRTKDRPKHPRIAFTRAIIEVLAFVESALTIASHSSP